MSEKLKIIEMLQQVQDNLYDADHILGSVKTTKETAELLERTLKHIGMADALLTDVLSHNWWR